MSEKGLYTQIISVKVYAVKNVTFPGCAEPQLGKKRG
jgi:hypothetical protein